MEKQRSLFIVLVISLVMCSDTIGQNLKSQVEIDSTQNGNKVRKVFVYSSIGVLEYFSLGVDYQISNKISISLEGSASFTGGGFIFPNDVMGIGTKISYYIPFSIFNVINFESIALLHQNIHDQTNVFIKGYYFDFNIGREVISENGLKVFWGVGVCGNNTIDLPGKFLYSLKVGPNYNFIRS